LGLQTSTQWRIHGPFNDIRAKAIQALTSSSKARFSKQAERMLECGAHVQIHTIPGKRPQLVVSRCKNRLCPACSMRRSWRVARRIEAVAKQADSPRFVTLTVKTDDHCLAEAVAKLRDGWKKLRKSDIWKSRVKGGVYSLEVSRGRQGDRWHPHLHIITDGSYLPQAALAEAWLRATGDSCIVDVRAIRSRREIARYVAKYVSKGDHLRSWSVEQIREYAEALAGARVVHTFGSLHGVQVDPREEPNPPLKRCGWVAFSALERWKNKGWPPAKRVWELIPRLGYDWRIITATGKRDDTRDQLPLVGEEAADLERALEACGARMDFMLAHPGREWEGKPQIPKGSGPLQHRFEYGAESPTRWKV
jgi:hypothetical protein